MTAVTSDGKIIAGERLTTFDVLPGGDRVRLNIVDADGGPCAITLPLDQLSGLLMTIPHIVQQALEVRSGDCSMRMVQPLGHWHLESAAGTERLILNLSTTDGFDVSFSVSRVDATRLGSALTATNAAPPALVMN